VQKPLSRMGGHPMASRYNSPAARSTRKVRTLAFPLEYRLRIIKLFMEGGCSARLLSATHDLNHQPCRCLGGGRACHAHFCRPRIRLFPGASGRRCIAGSGIWRPRYRSGQASRSSRRRPGGSPLLVTNKLIKIERAIKVEEPEIYKNHQRNIFN
jgi:hypothetical protein